MSKFNITYKIICYGILAIEFCFLIFAVVTRFQTGQIPYFGVSYKEHKRFFPYLELIENMLIVFLLAWGIISFIAVITGQFKFKRKHVIFGFVGIILSIVYVIADPFGSIKYLLD